MHCFCFVSFTVLVQCYVFVQADEEFEGLYSLPLEHSLGTEFSKRGVINIRSLKSGIGSFSTTQDAIDIDQLKSAAKENGAYRVRIPVRSQGDAVTYVSSFTPACSLLESGLSDVITVYANQSGSVIGVSIHTTCRYCQGRRVSDVTLQRFNTTVLVSTAVTGPAPDTQAHIERIEAERRAKEAGGVADNRSFFAKYWMYILPFVFLVVMMNNADQGQGGGGGGGR